MKDENATIDFYDSQGGPHYREETTRTGHGHFHSGSFLHGIMEAEIIISQQLSVL